ncbi:MAG: sensor histidine kinase [Propionibacteriaceae bacterium]
MASAGFATAVVVAVLVLVVAAVALLSPLLSPARRELFSDVALMPIAAMVLLTCTRTARRSTGRLRRAWALMALAGGLWALGEIGWFVDHYLVTARDPSVADVFSLAAVVPAAGALLLFPARSRVGRERLINLLGCLVAAGSVMFVARSIQLAFWTPTVGASTLANAVYAAYPAADTVLFALLLVALIRMGDRARAHLTLLAIGVACYTMADASYAVLSSLDRYTAGSVLDLGWFAGYLLLAVAALGPGASREDSSRGRRTSGGGGTALLVYLPVLGVAVTAAALPGRDPDLVLIVTGGGILVLFGVRQALLGGDLARLNQQRDEQLTVLRETSARLRRQVLQTQRITQSVADGIIVLDSAHRVVMANPSAADMLHTGTSELQGCRIEDLLVTETELRGDPNATVRPDATPVVSAITSGSVLIALDAFFQTPERAVPVELTVGPIREQEQHVGTVLVLRDITERRAVERLKNEFISVVSHELRTPLTSIRGSLALLDGGMGGALEPSGARMITLALESSKRLSRLIDDLLDVERMETGALTMLPEDCGAARLVELAQREMRGLAQQHGVELLRLETAGRVWADPDRIVQTLANLISNAVKFSAAGAQVTLSAVPVGEFVEFSVADQGRGIPADKLERVFDRFEQVDSSDSRQKGGTGLGLAICRNIVGLHGGRIWVTSQLGRGSDFRFRLPVPAAASAPDGPVGATNGERHVLMGVEQASPAAR